MLNRCLWVRLHIVNPKNIKLLTKNRCSFRIQTNKYITVLDFIKYYKDIV